MLTQSISLSQVPASAWLGVGFLLSLATIWSFIIVPRKNSKSGLPLPPSPPGSWLAGNLFELGQAVKQKRQHHLIAKWAREHGEVLRIRAGPVVQYYLNSDRAVKEIFERSSGVSSERPRWITSSEQICRNLNVLLLNSSNPRWKHHRKVTHNGLTSIPRADAGLAYLHYESGKFLHDAAELGAETTTGWQIYRMILRYTYSTFTSQIFGMDIPEDSDPVIQGIHETGKAQILGTLPFLSLVDAVPILDQLPLLLKPWERRNTQRFERDYRFGLEKLQRIRERRANGEAPDAFLPLVEANPDAFAFEGGPEEASYLAFMLVIGAADTSTISTWSFLEAMLLYPAVQERARSEILKVVGDRLPVYEDIHSIPYVRCLMKETWRWRPPVPLGHPHITTEELTYNGMRIPAGAELHLNAWAISHDPHRHPDPDEFIPERYLGDDTTTMQSANLSDPTKRDHYAFGAGRRICPGYHVAERSLAVAIMRILWAFRIGPSAGQSLPLDPLDFEGDLMPGVPDTRMPVKLTVLSPQKQELIDKYYTDSKTTRTQLVMYLAS